MFRIQTDPDLHQVLRICILKNADADADPGKNLYADADLDADADSCPY
jgi:hypothetical protein